MQSRCVWARMDLNTQPLPQPINHHRFHCETNDFIDVRYSVEETKNNLFTKKNDSSFVHRRLGSWCYYLHVNMQMRKKEKEKKNIWIHAFMLIIIIICSKWRIKWCKTRRPKNNGHLLNRNSFINFYVHVRLVWCVGAVAAAAAAVRTSCDYRSLKFTTKPFCCLWSKTPPKIMHFFPFFFFSTMK